MKSEKNVGFINGLITGFCISWILFMTFEDFTRPTELYVAKETLRSDSGLLIPKGTVVSFKSHYPEGITTYELYVNEEFGGESFSYKETKPHKYITPYYVSGLSDTTLNFKDKRE